MSSSTVANYQWNVDKILQWRRPYIVAVLTTQMAKKPKHLDRRHHGTSYWMNNQKIPVECKRISPKNNLLVYRYLGESPRGREAEVWKSRNTASIHVESNISANFDNYHIKYMHFLEVNAMPNNINGRVHTHKQNIEKNRSVLHTAQSMSIDEWWCAVACRTQIREGHVITLKGTLHKGLQNSVRAMEVFFPIAH